MQRVIRFFVVLVYLIIALLLPTGAVLADDSDLQSLYNDTVWYDPTSTVTCVPSGGLVSPLVGGDNIQKALNFLTGPGPGLKDFQAAAIVGNLEQESGQGLNPLAQQNGSSSKVPIPNVGFGIAQWTDMGRQQNLVDYAKQQKGQPSDLGIQLNFLWAELSGSSYASVLAHLKSTATVEDAVNQFVGPNDIHSNPVPPTYEGQRTGGYENPGTPHVSNRITYAKQALQSYGGGSGNASGGSGSSSCAGSVGAVSCNSSNAANTASVLSQTRQNVVCLAQQELATWKAQPWYPWSGQNSYSETGYLKYSQNRHEEWCADFATWIYEQAGYPLKPDPDWNIAYVPNIQAVGQSNQNFHWHPAGSGYTPKPGDLAIHGANHVNIFITSSGGASTYIGGDQGNGPYPGGSIVSIETNSGYYDSGITGYVSPD